VAWEVLDWKKDIFRPFILNNTNYYNWLTPNIDNKEEIYDISGERFPRYQSIIRMNDSYTMWNIGRKPKHWKWQLQYADNKDWVQIEIDYTVPQSLKVFVGKNQIQPNVAKS